jgi:hypothetical protein
LIIKRTKNIVLVWIAFHFLIGNKRRILNHSSKRRNQMYSMNSMELLIRFPYGVPFASFNISLPFNRGWKKTGY